MIVLKSRVAIHPINDALAFKREIDAVSGAAAVAAARGGVEGTGSDGDEARPARVHQRQCGGGGRGGEQGSDSIKSGLMFCFFLSTNGEGRRSSCF